MGSATKSSGETIMAILNELNVKMQVILEKRTLDRAQRNIIS